ncbi:hypothetical protein [Streptomyces phaeochromogenes]
MDEEEGPLAPACPACRVLVIWDDVTGECIHCGEPLKDKDDLPYLVRLKADRRRMTTLTED